ncbi:ABC transporter ATP-binding protein [Proteiniclasticum ruminis]|jgi:peptide/nickel transport system ATP-binding protein/oligopeptide transport system ATP-binding protein|uniref:Peptide/nickel transport system ATP-binding protein/oligopeptide transport system ATP-binding protein n=1 Tax=Proteiniclasticum ruminis TaxID=398199 RepID=A0A1G8GKA9_9CLOT|nr:oligopeptide/dipeptide ABC transporter ATP-binding protein [Proteiniclasticum ruminis]MBP9920463.1 ATP-binding cassette domain-containing protein [Proteiniclasticum sp.]SDH94793.1 peptide/nickel transport system ATP-binding protein/oligopeptide transport system ATP-binding protein [Proteiniclasticum ruminis]
MNENNRVLLEVNDIKKYFPVKSGAFGKKSFIKAVDGVTFKLNEGETIGLVGESGCGKSTLGRTIVRLYDPTDGQIIYHGKAIDGDIATLKGAQLKSLRREMQLIFQDPYSSLNPRLNVSNIVGESLLSHNLVKPGEEYKNRVMEIIEMCGLSPYHIYRYPHQFSGGQRQRIGIARALALNPDFIVADEPVSALDVSIQSQILNLMMDLQERMGLSYLFISHDLSVVKHISDRIGVMYLGSLVELAGKHELYDQPTHPYTRALLAAIPVPDPTHLRKMEPIIGELPSNVNTPPGCKFHTRCPYAKDICKEQIPILREFNPVKNPNHFVACHFAGEI